MLRHIKDVSYYLKIYIYIYISLDGGGYSIYKYVSCIDKNPEFFRIPRSYYGSK